MKHILLITLLGNLLMAHQPPHATQPIPAGTQAGQMHLEPCAFETSLGKYTADCGSLFVAENATQSDARLIRLPITRIRATAENPAEPIFYLGGGPGQSNMGFKPRPELLANHDVVIVGYRGVDGSVVLNCPEVEQAMKGVGRDLLSPQSLANLKHAFQQCAARLQAEGVDLNAYTMLDVVRDLEAARTALGYERVNLLSGSYGTRVAQIYAAQHPDHIHRSIMVAVNPPGRFVWEPAMADQQLAYYAQLCAQDAECHGRTPDLVQTIRHVNHNMPHRWLFLPIDAGKVKMVAFALLFSRTTAAQVFDAYVAAEQGDASGLALMSLAYDFVFPSLFVWGDMAAKGMSADYDPQRDYATEMDPSDAVLGAPFSKLLWSDIGWPTTPIPEPFRHVQRSEVETLLVSGSVDFSTPAEYATQELLPHLPHGRQIILKELGHTDLGTMQRPAMARLQSSFYDTGTADDSLFTETPMDFHVAWGFPKLAKLGLAGVLVLVSAVIGLIGFIVRRFRR